LQAYVKPKLVSQNKLIFSSVIIEQSEFFTIKLLVLHDKKKLPIVYSVGKIAGMKSIPVVNTYSAVKGSKYGLQEAFEESFSGNFGVQLIRFGSYAILIIGYVLFIIYLSGLYIKSKEKRFKQSVFNATRRYDFEKSKILYDIYLKFGVEVFIILDELANQDVFSKEVVNKVFDAAVKFKIRKSGVSKVLASDIEYYIFDAHSDSFSDFLVRLGVLKVQEDQLTYSDSEYRLIIQSLLAFFRVKKLFDKRLISLE
jgi:hypothetical protein